MNGLLLSDQSAETSPAREVLYTNVEISRIGLEKTSQIDHQVTIDAWIGLSQLIWPVAGWLLRSLEVHRPHPDMECKTLFILVAKHNQEYTLAGLASKIPDLKGPESLSEDVVHRFIHHAVLVRSAQSLPGSRFRKRTDGSP